MSQILELKQGVLDKNDFLAQGLRGRFHQANVFVSNWVSSPGSGKTALLEATLRILTERGFSAAALVGDLATENDAKRLARSGAPVRQIVTAGCCHLEADMIDNHLKGWDLSEFDFLFIENVGNLVCPSSYDLGEEIRIVLMSVTEGEDKPLKYPPMFNSADLAVITKIDLAEAVEFDREAAYESIHAVRPHLPILETSAKRGTGMDAWIDYLVEAKNGVAGSR
ncbi:MAG: hydrogenase nickel incorporation protein HypB [Anaerolineales bacterium]|nr:hydrogenase nickel incorporation protein HypB [Anaerolineales bacterium]